MGEKAYIVVDLGFGDAGKGATVDWLAATRDVRAVVRFNGGPQAGHNVVTPDGRHHTFSQLGAASFLPGVLTLLPACVHLHPLALLSEEAHLRTQGVSDALDRLAVEVDTPIVTPFHQATQRLRELARGGARHGSCGTGFGESVALTLDDPDLTLRAGALHHLPTLHRKLRAGQERARHAVAPLRDALRHLDAARRELDLLDDPHAPEDVADTFAALAPRLQRVGPEHLQHLASLPGDLVFEGAQGVLLDEWRGFHPFTTWSTTTAANADLLLDRARFTGRRVRLGLTRAYGTRHGPGPFPAEHPALTADLPDPHNGHNPWQLDFRVGWLDLVLLRYAIASTAPLDALVVNHLDRVLHLPAWSLADAWLLPEPPSPLLAAADPHHPHRLTHLLPSDAQDLQRQELLTRLASLARPVLTEVQPASAPIQEPLRRAQPLLDALQHHLHTPVALVATGPSRSMRHRTLDGGDLLA